MKVIGVGLPRTATLSQKIALETLGIAPCYHMVNVLSDLRTAESWRQVLRGDRPIQEMLDGFQATVDWPGAFFYPELIQAYPDAKVLLSARSGDSWARSMRRTIWGVVYGDLMIRHLSDARRQVDAQWAGYIELMSEMWQRSGLMTDAGTTMEYMSRAMERYNAEVINAVDPDRLLVWAATDGWEPLCEFLELPVPDTPFPRVNDSAQFADRIIDGAIECIQHSRGSRATAGAAG